MAGFLERIVKQTPLETFFGATGRGGQRNTALRPTETLGRPGTAIYGGYIVEVEKDGRLSDRERYRTFSELLLNCSVAAAGVRYFLNLCAKAGWTFTPADHPDGERLAELAHRMIVEDPATSWQRIIRRAAMYRFYGFSIQEWTAQRDNDGNLTFADIAPRAQITIERWDMNTDGSLNGVVQRSPQNQEEIYLPRGKLLYIVDDSLNDSPQGLGLFRHIVEPVRRLQRYEQLEGFGYETDLRGVPVARVPYAELRRRVESGEISEAQAVAAVRAAEQFVQKHVKNPALGLVLDSSVYLTTDESQRPSSARQFDMSLLEGSQTSLPDIARAIERLNREIARVLGVEAILLGDNDRGSFALAQSKTNQFSLTIDSTLGELATSMRDDILRPLWMLNGWPEEAMPTMKPEAVQYRDIEQIAAGLRDIASTGVTLGRADQAVQELFGLFGLTPPEDDDTEEQTEEGDEPPPEIAEMQEAAE